MYAAGNLCTPLYNGSTKYLNTYHRIIYNKSIRCMKHSEISAVFIQSENNLKIYLEVTKDFMVNVSSKKSVCDMNKYFKLKNK